MKFNKMYLTVSVFLFLGHNCIFGQSSYLKLIVKEDFKKAEKWLSKDIIKKPEDIEMNFCMSILLKDRKYTGYNIEQSYIYMLKAKQYFESNLAENIRKKLEKIPIDQFVISNFNDSICCYALEDEKTSNKVEDYQHFLDFYKTAPIELINKATRFINEIQFNIALRLNTPESYQYFITTYPKASQINYAKSNRDILAFEQANKEHTSISYKSFLDHYPQSKQYKQAYDLFENTQFHENITNGTSWKQYAHFIENYPNNSLKEVAEDSILSYIRRTKDIEVAQYSVDNFNDSNRNRALILYHDLYTNDGEKQTLDLFYEKHEDEIPGEIKTKDYELVGLSDDLKLYASYDSTNYSQYDTYIRLAAPRELAFVALQRMISPYILSKKWNLAIEKINGYSRYFGLNNKKITDLLLLLESDTDKTIKISSVGSGINTDKGGEYVPVISANDKLLYFCGRDRKDNLGGEDIFVSKKMKGIWTQAKIVTDLSSALDNDAPLSISADGTEMLLFKSGSIFYSDKTKKGWSEPIKFPEQINGGKWQADAMITSDGKALLFASTKSGGYNTLTDEIDYHGDNQFPSDLYVSTLNENNEWSEPINLGNVINTQFCERSPFLHPDMKTLYFSSDGHGGMGKLDVYKSTRLADSCWNCWSEPINMGKEFNTQGSDWSYKISTNGEVAYFSKTNSTGNSDDIYSVNLPKYLRPDLVATISGKLIDKDNQPITADIRWEDLETGKSVGKSKSDPADGSFFIVLPIGKIYGYFVDQDKYFPLSKNIDLRSNKIPVQIEENINMVTFKQMIEDGTAVPVNNLFFNFAESSLLPFSLPELKRVASIIKANKLNVEISGHTDNIGDDQKNQLLSEQRALSVKDYLIDEGCNKEAINIKGFGKTRPVASNETEEGRSKNRRVELKFIK